MLRFYTRVLARQQSASGDPEPKRYTFATLLRQAGGASVQASIWTTCLIPVGVAFSLGLFRRIFPVRKGAPSELPLTDDERRVYRRWEVMSLLPCFIFALTLAFLWCLALMGTAGLFLHETPGTCFLVKASWVFWGIPSGFLGIITSSIPLGGLYRVLLRDRARRYDLYCSEPQASTQSGCLFSSHSSSSLEWSGASPTE